MGIMNISDPDATSSSNAKKASSQDDDGAVAGAANTLDEAQLIRAFAPDLRDQNEIERDIGFQVFYPLDIIHLYHLLNSSLGRSTTR